MCTPGTRAGRCAISSRYLSSVTPKTNSRSSPLRLGDPQRRKPAVDCPDHAIEVADLGLVLPGLTPHSSNRQCTFPRRGHRTELLVLPGHVGCKYIPSICRRAPEVGGLQGVRALRDTRCG